MAEYYTKKDQVKLKSGEKLGFTPGRGYYAIAAATPVSTEEIGGLSVSQAEKVAESYGLATTTDGDEGSSTSSSSSSTTSTSKPPTKHPTQPSKAPTAAARTPAAVEAAAKSMITDAYRPVVFKTSTKAKPNAALIEAAHRQGGTVARPATVAKTTKPATANAKKNEAKSVKPATTATSKKTAVKSTAPAARHSAVARATTFHTYKRDVRLKPGQTLGYTVGKGYYAKASNGGSSNPGKPQSKQGPVSYHTRKGDVPLQPGQTLAHTSGKGYYAKGSTHPLDHPGTPRLDRVLEVHADTRHGHYEHIISSKPVAGGYLVTTEKDSVAIDWPIGKGGGSIDVDLRDGDIAAKQGGFSFTDPGVLRTLWNDLSRSGDLHDNLTQLVPGATITETFPLDPTFSFNVSFSGRQHIVTLTKATLSVSLSVVAGITVADVQLSTGFKAKSPAGAPVEVAYSIGTSTRYDAGKNGKELTALEILALAGVVGVAGLALAVRGATIPPGLGPPR